MGLWAVGCCRLSGVVGLWAYGVCGGRGMCFACYKSVLQGRASAKYWTAFFLRRPEGSGTSLDTFLCFMNRSHDCIMTAACEAPPQSTECYANAYAQAPPQSTGAAAGRGGGDLARTLPAHAWCRQAVLTLPNSPNPPSVCVVQASRSNSTPSPNPPSACVDSDTELTQ